MALFWDRKEDEDLILTKATSNKQEQKQEQKQNQNSESKSMRKKGKKRGEREESPPVNVRVLV